MIIIPEKSKADKTALFNESRASVERIYAGLKGRLILRSLYRLSPNHTLLQGQSGMGGDNFTPIEQLACGVIVSSGIIAGKSIRHGEASKNECDIVINEDKQIEVVTAMFDGAGLEEGILPCLAYEKEVTLPTGVLKKFDEKNYTSSFSKGLCIVYGGNANNEMALTIAIRDHLFDHYGIPSKNHFTSVYMIRYNIDSGTYELLVVTDDGTGRYTVACDGLTIVPLIHKKQVLLEEVLSDEFYYLDVVADDGQIPPVLVLRGSKVADAMRCYGIVS